MAPHKRTQADSDEDDASSNSSNATPSKRRRTSDSISISGKSDGSVITDQSEARDREETEAPFDEVDLEDEDTLEQQQTQFIRDKHHGDEPNIPADCGIIERVDCFNFMCHEHFSVDLGPLINFIVGKNGSGKSAILTALTLCLGAKASVTNRGQSLKSFIKEGKESATIIVRIKNQGDGAYMPNEYGKSIIVERSFSKSGTSGFKIKNESGKIMSTKKADLDSITDYFNLQIDNPMNVLSQDMARQFLSSSSPAEKYKFFVKGVQLEQLDNDYRLIEESVDAIKEMLDSRKEDLKVLRAAKERAQRRMELSDQRATLRQRIKKLRSQMAWAQVEEQERIRDEIQEEVAKLDGQIAFAESETAIFDRKYEEAQRELETATELLNNTKEALSKAEEERNVLKEANAKEMAEHHNVRAEQRRIHESVKTLDSQIEDLKQHIAEENRRLADIAGGDFARRREEIVQRRAEAEEADQRLTQHQGGSRALQEAIHVAEQNVKQAVAPVQKQKKEIEQAENLLRSLSRDRGQTNSGFSEKMPQLLNAIAREKSFNQRPIGPVGHHVRLKKPEWSAVIEQSLNNTLNSFIVTSKRDMNILMQTMQKVQCVMPILIGSNGTIDTSANEPDPRFDTILSVLEIDEDIVRRQLIINHAIEQIVLIENVEEASKILFEGGRVRNVRRCLCIDARDRRRGVTLSYGRTGEPSQAPIAPFTGRPRMRSDIDSQIRLQQDNIQALKRELNELQSKVSTSQAELQRCKDALAEHKAMENELRIEAQRISDATDALEDALEKDQVVDGRLETLQNTLNEREGEQKVAINSLDDAKAAIDTITDELKRQRKAMSAKDAEIRPLQENVRIAEQERIKVDEQRRAVLADKNQAYERVNDLKQEREARMADKGDLDTRVTRYIEQASLISPRVPVDEGETPESLDRKLDKIQKDIERYDKQMGASREEIAAELVKASKALKTAEAVFAENEKAEKELKRTVNYRRERWKNFRAHISSRAKAQFTYLLSERSFRGRLLMDHDAKLLDLQVEPDITKNSKGRGTKTLSGGEKSFSQICLLLSLWEAMGSPIRCLDEFDVYMDHINRKSSIDMLMLAARRSIGRQFILITPGSRSDISLAPDVRVKELAEPERGQSTLTFRAS
ncbi:DNA repair protein Rad18, putative [Talaromyces stipitatus ATCC 10500]|uniref:DNA repair protein Rad18, putative n=1 Tax=Talaromyces stipitatus (strain ATCC 10500 / CBS 375.48 / QM 6759 / NRRL 1006) TaxID=441959 RepID=B8MNR2_TALSN|nr:DNA repair protein Rad18, putative [Talaromyces stipitatus ATCC 10500]EED14151.1 DNA repair protein Rad18, putative [Talaromyces stipitatus ATCC 10500]